MRMFWAPQIGMVSLDPVAPPALPFDVPLRASARVFRPPSGPGVAEVSDGRMAQAPTCHHRSIDRLARRLRTRRLRATSVCRDLEPMMCDVRPGRFVGRYHPQATSEPVAATFRPDSIVTEAAR
jgi:hypothetical protein